jgi:hypothetical protein
MGPYFMSVRKKRTLILPAGRQSQSAFIVYIGVDLHRKTTQVAAVNRGGELLANLPSGA